MNEDPNKINVKASDEILRGFYANVMQISHTHEEFILDFINIVPPSGVLGSRIILSPGHLKRAVRALRENLERYEDNFGVVDETELDFKKVGFKTE